MKAIIASIAVTVGIYYIGMFLLPFLIPFFFGAWFIKYLTEGQHQKNCDFVSEETEQLLKQFKNATKPPLHNTRSN